MRGHVAKKGNNYYVVTPAGKYPNGRTKYKWHSPGYRTKKQAQTACNTIVDEINRTGRFIEPRNITVTELLDEWLSKAKLKPTTCDRYASVIKHHLKPALGHMLLPRLRAVDIEACLDDAKPAPRKAEGRGAGKPRTEPLKEGTRAKHFRILRAALNYAVRREYIAENPCLKIESPPTEPKTQEAVVQSAEDVQRLLSQAAAGSGYPFGRLLVGYTLMTSLRRGEVLGQRWSDLYWDDDWRDVGGIGVITQTLVQLDDGALLLQPSAKTPDSLRMYGIPPSIVEELIAHRKAQVAKRLQAGDEWQDNDLVFCTDLGKPLNPSNWRRAWLKIRKRAGMERLKFHGLRHTFGTLMMDAPDDLRINQRLIAAQFGHADTATLERKYQHATPAQLMRLAKLADRIMRGVGAADSAGK